MYGVAVGNTAKATLRINGAKFAGDVLLETSELIVRDERRLRVPFSDIKSPRAENGALAFKFKGDDVAIEIGKEAAKWLDKIVNPKSVVEKLGVKAGQRVSLVDIDDKKFESDLESRGATITRGKNLDMIFFGAHTRDGLARLAKLRDSLASNGALWIIRPKGTKEITESETMAAGKAAGLVDVKVVRFSDTHTAEKFVIPVSLRK